MKASSGSNLTFGEWLDDRLREKGWTQADFAAVLGVAPTTVNAWVNNVNTPTRRSARMIATALAASHTSVLYLAGRSQVHPDEEVKREREAHLDAEAIDDRNRRAGTTTDLTSIDPRLRTYFLGYPELPPHLQRILLRQLEALFDEAQEERRIDQSVESDN